MGNFGHQTPRFLRCDHSNGLRTDLDQGGRIVHALVDREAGDCLLIVASIHLLGPQLHKFLSLHVNVYDACFDSLHIDVLSVVNDDVLIFESDDAEDSQLVTDHTRRHELRQRHLAVD